MTEACKGVVELIGAETSASGSLRCLYHVVMCCMHFNSRPRVSVCARAALIMAAIIQLWAIAVSLPGITTGKCIQNHNLCTRWGKYSLVPMQPP